MIRWAGWIITFCGVAHTIGALTIEKAARHAGTWFSGGLWDEPFTDMSPAGSAYWLSMASFGVPLFVVGLTVLWMDRRGIVPPTFIAWILGAWTAVDAVVLISSPWPLFLVGMGLLLAGARRARTGGAPGEGARRTGAVRP